MALDIVPHLFLFGFAIILFLIALLPGKNGSQKNKEWWMIDMNRKNLDIGSVVHLTAAHCKLGTYELTSVDGKRWDIEPKRTTGKTQDFLDWLMHFKINGEKIEDIAKKMLANEIMIRYSYSYEWQISTARA